MSQEESLISELVISTIRNQDGVDDRGVDAFYLECLRDYFNVPANCTKVVFKAYSVEARHALGLDDGYIVVGTTRCSQYVLETKDGEKGYFVEMLPPMADFLWYAIRGRGQIFLTCEYEAIG